MVLSGYVALVTFLGKELRLPQTGLDESWEQALVESTDQNRTFGKEVIFTYGPLHQVITDQVSSDLKPLLIGRIIFFISLFSIAALIGFQSGMVGLCVFCLGIFFLQSWGGWAYGKKDVIVILLLFWTFIFGSYFYLNKKQNNQWKKILLGLSVLGCTTASLVKLSFLMFIAPIILLLIIFNYTQEPPLNAKRLIGKVVFSVCIIALLNCFLWYLSTGKSFIDYINYFVGPNFDAMKGYAAAMGRSRSVGLTILQFLLSIFIFKTLLKNVQGLLFADARNNNFENNKNNVLINIALIITGFILFKVSFVRNDGHAILFSHVCIGILFFLLSLKWKEVLRLWIEGRRGILFQIWIMPIILSLLLSYIGGWRPSPKTGIFAFFLHPPKTILTLFTEFGRRQLVKTRTAKNLENKKDVEDYLISSPETTTADIIPWDVSDLKANGLIYLPRPIPQSYAAYTEKLQNINAKFFEDPKKSPEYMIVSFKDIDDRHPTSLDGPSLRLIFQNYKLSHKGSKESFIFKNTRVKMRINDKKQEGLLQWEKSDLMDYKSQIIKIPKTKDNIWLSLKTPKSKFQKVTEIIYKPFSLYIEYLDKNKKTLKKFRIVCNAANDILLFSKMLELDKEKKLDPTFFRLSTKSIGSPFPNSAYIISEDLRP